MESRLGEIAIEPFPLPPALSKTFTLSEGETHKGEKKDDLDRFKNRTKNLSHVWEEELVGCEVGLTFQTSRRWRIAAERLSITNLSPLFYLTVRFRTFRSGWVIISLLVAGVIN